jgi:hypothetical protein
METSNIHVFSTKNDDIRNERTFSKAQWLSYESSLRALFPRAPVQ